jgi:hypothetical protein
MQYLLVKPLPVFDVASKGGGYLRLLVKEGGYLMLPAIIDNSLATHLCYSIETWFEAIRILTSEVESLPPDDKLRALDFLSSALSQKFRRVEAKTGDWQRQE